MTVQSEFVLKAGLVTGAELDHALNIANGLTNLDYYVSSFGDAVNLVWDGRSRKGSAMDLHSLSRCGYDHLSLLDFVEGAEIVDPACAVTKGIYQSPLASNRL